MARNDFNGDGRSDILWVRSQSTAASDWLGDARGGFLINDVANRFNFFGPNLFTMIATGDFNGDGRTDTLWRINNIYVPALSSRPAV